MENIFLLLFLLSFVGLIIGLVKPSLFKGILKDQATRGGVAKIFGTSIVAFFILFGITSDSSKKTNDKIATQQSVAPQVTNNSVETTAATQPTPAPVQEKSKTKEELLWGAFEQGINEDHEGYAIVFDEKKGEATLTKAPKDYWDEVSVLKEGYKDFVKFGIQAFKIDGIKKMTLSIKVAVTDKYGKGSTDNGAILSMTKEQFEKFDWESMKGKNLYADMYTDDFSEEYVNGIIARVIMQKGGEVPLFY